MDRAPATRPDFAISFGALPPLFHRQVSATAVAAPRWVLRNDRLAADLGIDPEWLASEATLAALAGNAALPNATPLAMAYSGHQFGGWNPLLGDGRALLIGEWRAPGGALYDLHLKGSGPTPFSRNGDGRATLGAMVREYIVSEAMAGLAVPTTRSLAVVATGEPVHRRQPEPGAVLTRIARSHVRVGTFQLAASRQDREALKALADYEITRNFPEPPKNENAYLWFLRQVIARQAPLIARWMAVGFIHGVMNTDNMQVAGETIDFGPCAFMDRFHPQKVFSSIDEYGRYAWDKQPTIALWNLTRLAECLLTLIDDDLDRAVEKAKAELAQFMPAFEKHFEDGLRAKLGLLQPHDNDGEFIAGIFRHLMEGEVDFTLFFRRLTAHAAGEAEQPVIALFNSMELAQQLLSLWRERLALNPSGDEHIATMRAANPIVIARNHRVEEAVAAANGGDTAPALRLVAALQKPFSENSTFADLELPPRDDEVVRQTFCGT